MANHPEARNSRLREAKENERDSAARVEAFRSALIAGEESGFVEGDPFEQLHEFLHGLPKMVGG